MDTVLLGARLLLAAVFAVAGLAKLADRAGSRQAIVDFGLPAVLARPFGMLLPLAELAVAVALIPVITVWWGALGALALLLLFVVGISVNLARGRRPHCHCFGQLHSAPVGWATLIRNGLLAAVAGFVVWSGPANVGPSAVSRLATLTLVQTVELVLGSIILGLLGVEGWALLQLLRQNGRLLLRIEALEARLATGGTVAAPDPAPPTRGLPIGTVAPAFGLSGLYGETLTLDALRSADKPVMLVFSDPGCGPCNALLPDLARWQRDYASKLTIAMISRGTPEVNRAKSTEHGLTHVLLQQDREVATAYQAHGTPSAVLVSAEGVIDSGLAGGADAIRELVARTTGTIVPTPTPNGRVAPVAPMQGAPGNGNPGTPARPTAPKIGELAPPLKLPDLAGKLVDLADFRGSSTLVLFWNPGCGFCQRMLEDLKAWEANPPKGAPRLLVVSTGAIEANRALDLRAPVLIDQTFAMGQTFGANGTPMAVLIDATGRIASDVVAGAPAVLALAKDPHQIKLTTA